TGSGILSLIASKNASHVLGVDINERAIEVAKSNAHYNKVENVDFKKSDLFEEVEEKYDVILFNPPYLPVEGEDKIWSGGKDGRQVIERFTKDFKKYLKKSGKVYMLISSLTVKKEVKELFRKVGMRTNIIDEEKVPWEELYVLEIKK
ncbi:MAG: HemK2/MTQ2 family protein methyltransferase, partial [Candidatus Aenigmatarchaeota archaeon]